MLEKPCYYNLKAMITGQMPALMFFPDSVSLAQPKLITSERAIGSTFYLSVTTPFFLLALQLPFWILQIRFLVEVWYGTVRTTTVRYQCFLVLVNNISTAHCTT